VVPIAPPGTEVPLRGYGEGVALSMGSIAVGSAVMDRSLSAAGWIEAGLPLLRDPRALVTDLHRVHRPAPGTVVVGVLDQLGRVSAGASFPVAPLTQGPGGGDGWQYRNAVLSHLRRVIPHDLRRSSPVRTAVLMLCRHGGHNWTSEDGAWMWALQDASTLHGLRCGAYVTLTDEGWQVLGDSRRGRIPHCGSWAQGTVRSVSSLPVRALMEPVRVCETQSTVRVGSL
jgi:hypothetical protein